jgi:hypothetical protein
MGTAVARDFAFVTTTDFITGSSSSVWMDGSYGHSNNVAAIHSDAVARYFGGLVYVVNRFGGDNIQVLDPNNGFSTIKQFSVDNGSDPHDIIVLDPTKAYVTRYNTTDLWIVNPSTGSHTGTIGLSSLADADGLPEMDMMALVGNHLFITIQRLDRDYFWVPSGTSYVAVVDVSADTLVDIDPITAGVQAITLTGTNPFGDIQLDPYAARLYISCAGFFGVTDGGVEVINPGTFLSEGFIFTESSAGGDINDVEILKADMGYAIISDASFNNVLIRFDPHTGVKLGTMYAPGAYVLNDIELSPDGELFLTDRTPTQPGIRIYDTSTNTEITTNPIDVGLPPFDITFSVAIQTGIGETPPSILALGQNYPNPFNPETRIPFSLDTPGTVNLTIYDAAGRHVRTLVRGPQPAGEQEIVWDGRDDALRPVASGVYFVALRAAGRYLSKKLVLLR